MFGYSPMHWYGVWIIEISENSLVTPLSRNRIDQYILRGGEAVCHGHWERRGHRPPKLQEERDEAWHGEYKRD